MEVFGAYSRYYNLFYQDKDYPGEAEYVESLIGKHLPGAKSILDLGCGTGRHDLLLAQMGYQVAGVDMSEEMLAVANTQLADLTPHPSSLNFHHGDIRSIRLEQSFDVVVSLFHVMSYQTGNEELAAAFATVRAHLKPGGICIFDCWYGPAVLTDRPVVRIKRLEDEEIAVTRLVEPVMYPDQNLVELKYHVFIRVKESGVVEEIKESHLMRYLFRPELELLLREAGLTLIDASEWMTGRKPGFDTWGVCFVVQG
ncbi:MAG: methyltransferase type 11 [Geobacteraceae bacterium GWC2_58_44]|nr:MAG: methyltransferase type 11 [Geobacteraceae bacterium GWC2_58_44]HBG05741.1 SAM-dependent methyltransferase [Geobacter sp.]